MQFSCRGPTVPLVQPPQDFEVVNALLLVLTSRRNVPVAIRCEARGFWETDNPLVLADPGA